MNTNIFANPHEVYMQMALQEAERAYQLGEVPVGAVVVSNGKILAKAHNLTQQLNDVTAHAEMQAITAAADTIGGKYLNTCTLYVSLEPCLMCAAALHWAQLKTLVYGAADIKAGFNTYKAAGQPPILHPRTEVVQGIMANASADLLRRFFKERRK